MTAIEVKLRSDHLLMTVSPHYVCMEASSNTRSLDVTCSLHISCGDRKEEKLDNNGIHQHCFHIPHKEKEILSCSSSLACAFISPCGAVIILRIFFPHIYCCVCRLFKSSKGCFLFLDSKTDNEHGTVSLPIV